MGRTMMTLDSSVVIPTLDSTHESHEQAITFVEGAGELRLITHVVLETYNTLTRTRRYRRLPAGAVAGVLRNTFPGPLVELAAEDYWTLMDRAPQLGIVGGAIFDALIATAAVRSGLKLISRDQRASKTYSALGVDFELLPNSMET
ncbi:MAG: PIN domain-containing protein [Candidatus Dormibacteraceae bacterium]